MITIEQIVAYAIRERVVMDHLGEALRGELCLANPYYRRLAEFADSFLMTRGKLPAGGDWQVWIEGLPQGMIRDGTLEALNRIMATPIPEGDATYFATEVTGHLRTAAAQVARSRLNELPQLTPEAFLELAKQVDAVQSGAVQGLARLADVDVWMAHTHRDAEWVPTGFSKLDNWIGGWGKELWIVFADTGMGKSMLLQNCAAAAARRGGVILHVTLELGLRPQILRYYRQLAEASRSDFANSEDIKKKLGHWFRLARGEILLLEFPAYSLDPESLSRTIARVGRAIGKPVSMVILDYLDLMTPAARHRAGKAYEDLGRLTHEIRGLCPHFDLTVLTASQAVRRPAHSGRLTMRDMGDSYKKVQGADGLLSLCQTEEEKEVFQGRLELLKARDSGGMGQVIPLYINRELSVIQQLEHPNTYQLMQRLGHTPEQLARKVQQQQDQVAVNHLLESL